jgi:hypothetical protein
MLTVDQTVRSYSGRPGCMCGCQGSYNDGERARKMAVTALLKNPAVRLQSWNLSGGDAGCLFVNTPTRTRVLYLTQAGVDAARAMGVAEYK